ncbi:MAG: histidine phosphatase family protein [Gammaproteobacteria bacterium]|nr:histidine phosphatase family protein [Gammaproteobacteria bacterium]
MTGPSPIRIRRRPHLAPLLVPLLVVLAAGAGIFWIGTWAQTTVVILVRHAETDPVASGDPDLSKAGEARVKGLGDYLAGVLSGGKVDYLYSADTRRAQQTAAPIANQFKLPINLLSSSDWAGLASRIKREHRGKTIAVVGYASTIPGVLSELSATSVALAEDEYDSIFLVVVPSPGPTRVFRLSYGPPTVPPRTAP